MKIRHAAALALMGWYLIVPPAKPKDNPDLNAPLYKWLRVAPANSAQDCEQVRAAMFRTSQNKLSENARVALEHSMCISADDPRLKEPSK